MATACYPLTTGGAPSWFVADTVSVTRDFSVSWNVAAIAVESDYSVSSDVLTFAQQDYALSWDEAGAVSTDYATSWEVIGTVERDYALTWDAVAAVTADFAVSWDSGQAYAQADYSVAWDGGGYVTSDHAFAWDSAGSLTADFSVTWGVSTSVTRGSPSRCAKRIPRCAKRKSCGVTSRRVCATNVARRPRRRPSSTRTPGEDREMQLTGQAVRQRVHPWQADVSNTGGRPSTSTK